MIGLMIACLVVNIITLIVLVVWVIIMGGWHFKKDKKHQEEKEKLEKSRDYHIDQLKKRSGESSEVGCDLGEREIRRL